MKPLVLSLFLSCFMLTAGYSQTASEWANNAFLPGTDNSGFGFNTLGSAANPSFHNTAVGKDALSNLILAGRNTAVGWSALLNTGSVIFNGGEDNTGVGHSSLLANTTGIGNSALGNYSLFSNISGAYNSACGMNALYSNIDGQQNVGVGLSSLYSNVGGSFNTGVGVGSLFTNSSGVRNTALGMDACYYNQTGEENTAVGFRSMYGNPVNFWGSYNTSLGTRALYAISSGYYNTASGWEAMYINNTGWYNCAYGAGALYNNWDGGLNVAIGVSAMWGNQSGSNNVAIGTNTAWFNYGDENTAVGAACMYNNAYGRNNVALGSASYMASGGGSQNTILGSYADLTWGGFGNATAIGYFTRVNASNKVRIGNTAVTVVEGPVMYTVSDGRFKSNITEEDVIGLEFIRKLRPVVYNFEAQKFEDFLTKDMPDSLKKKAPARDFGPATAIRQSGFIAQEVEKAAKEVGYDFNGVHTPESDNDNYSLSYAQFVVPLVKGMQEQQQMIEDQKQTITNLQKQLDEVKALLLTNQSLPGKASVSGTTQNVELSDKNVIVLNQNVPNPFAESTVITYNIPSDFSTAQLLFTTADGNVIKTVDISTKGKGVLNVFASDLTSGLYKYSLIVDGKVIDSKTLVKN